MRENNPKQGGKKKKWKAPQISNLSGEKTESGASAIASLLQLLVVNPDPIL